jgi:phage baseplate assembly protein W
MNNPLIGRGLRFPFFPDANGSLGYVEDNENIQQSLKILLLTELGQRVMRYEFGSRVAESVFAPNSDQFRGRLSTSIREAVRDWEPRIDLDQVRIETDLNLPSKVIVSVDYRVRQTNSRQNLVFPYYLGTQTEV